MHYWPVITLYTGRLYVYYHARQPIYSLTFRSKDSPEKLVFVSFIYFENQSVADDISLCVMMFDLIAAAGSSQSASQTPPRIWQQANINFA